jgi:hypothetical protein
MMTALSRFISKLGERGMPFYKLLRKADDFQWEDRSIEASRELALRHPSDQAFTSHNTAILDVWFLLSGGLESV